MHSLVIAGSLSAAIALSTFVVSVSQAPTATSDSAVERHGRVGPDMDLLAAYERCSQDAAVRLLSLGEATQCSEIYLHLKLSFLPDKDVATFQSLPAEDRWQIQKRGYAALVAWRGRQTGL